MALDDGVSLVFEDVGETTQKLISYEVDSTFTTVTDGFSFTLYSDDTEKLLELTKPLSRVSFYVNGIKQLDGRIDSRSIQMDGTITIQGRDWLAQIADGFVDNVSLKEGMSIETAILKGLKPWVSEIDSSYYNKTRSTVSNNVATYSGVPVKDYKTITVSDWKSNPNEGAFEFCQRIMKRSGLFIQPTMEPGKIALTVPEYRQEPLYTFSCFTHGIGNNVLSMNMDEDWSQVPTVVGWHGTVKDTPPKKAQAAKKTEAPKAKSDKEVLAMVGITAKKTTHTFRRVAVEHAVFGSKALSSIGSNARAMSIVDGKIIEDKKAANDPNKLYRPLFVKDSESKSASELVEFARREVQSRLRNILKITVELAGHSDPKTHAIYSVDTMADVKYGIGQVFERMWVERRTFRYSPGAGPTTSLELWLPNSFTFAD